MATATRRFLAVGALVLFATSPINASLPTPLSKCFGGDLGSTAGRPTFVVSATSGIRVEKEARGAFERVLSDPRSGDFFQRRDPNTVSFRPGDGGKSFRMVYDFPGLGRLGTEVTGLRFEAGCVQWRTDVEGQGGSTIGYDLLAAVDFSGGAAAVDVAVFNCGSSDPGFAATAAAICAGPLLRDHTEGDAALAACLMDNPGREEEACPR